MSKRNIRKVAVLGSGVMGSRIACHFANVGCEVLLLDIPPREGNFRNAVANRHLAFALSNPPHLRQALRQADHHRELR